MPKEVLIFGGSFDPFGSNHLNCVQYLRARHPTCRIWIFPSFRHPEKNPDLQTPFADRVRMAQLATSGIHGVSVWDLEEEAFRANGTFKEGKARLLTHDLLRYLQQKFPSVKFRFVIGEDLIDKVSSWEKGPEIQRDFGFVTMPNMGGVHMTVVRNMIQKSDPTWKTLVPPLVANFISRHNLYVK